MVNRSFEKFVSHPQRHDLGMIHHGAQRRGELLSVYGSRMQPAPNVRARKRRPLPGDSIEGDAGVGDDQIAVLPHDPVLFRQTILGHIAVDISLGALLAPADMRGGLQPNALLDVAAVIDAHVVASSLQRSIAFIRPSLPPIEQKLRGVPIPALLAEAILIDATRGQDNVRVRVGRIVVVNAKISNHAGIVTLS